MITLYKAFKYDNRYDYIKTFSTKTEQDKYFSSLDKIYYDEQGDYIREHVPFMIEYSHQFLVENSVNYLKFNNGYRDIYAFIVEKRYINDEVTEIEFEIDVIQTFMFDFTIKNSFIERKNCSIAEITDFDEGLNIGEHEIKETLLNVPKEYTFFAMFNGIKEQQIVFKDNSNKIDRVVDLPFPTSKPLTMIDNIQYPCYFMPLQETYSEPTVTEIINDYISTSNVVTSARKLLGKPYIWGGNYPPLGTSEGTDCSGLCQWAYNDNGLISKIGLTGRWTTFTMYPYFTSVTSSRSGDLIFSSYDDSGNMIPVASWNGQPSHVAMITDSFTLSEGCAVNIIEALSEGYPIKERTLIYESEWYVIKRPPNV